MMRLSTLVLLCSALALGQAASVNGVPNQSVAGTVGAYNTSLGPWMGMTDIPGLTLATVSDNVAIPCASPPCTVDIYTVPAGYYGWVKLYAFNTTASTLNWYEYIKNTSTFFGSATYYLNSSGVHNTAASTLGHDNTTTGLPPSTTISVNVSAAGLSVFFEAWLVPTGNVKFRPLIYTPLVQGDNVVYTCCSGQSFGFLTYPLSNPLIGSLNAMFVTNLNSSTITYKVKLLRNGGSKAQTDQGTAAQNTAYQSDFNTIFSPGDELIINTSGGGTTASSLTASESGSTVTVATTQTPNANDTVVMSGCTPTGYNGTFVITSASGTQFQYTNPTTGLGAATGCTANTGLPGQMFIAQVYEGSGS